MKNGDGNAAPLSRIYSAPLPIDEHRVAPLDALAAGRVQRSRPPAIFMSDCQSVFHHQSRHINFSMKP